MESREKIKLFLKKGILISPEALEEADESMLNAVEKDVIVLERQHTNLQPKVKVISNYTKESTKRTFDHFVKYFNHRYTAIQSMLKSRVELERLTSIQRVNAKTERELVSVIGIVSSKSETKNKNIMLELEDRTGKTKVVVSRDKGEVYGMARDIVLDEVIGVTGTSGGNIIFANNIVHPDIPLHRELKKSPIEEYAVFISDVEIGSHNFLQAEFEKFIAWLNGSVGDDMQKTTASKVKYMFIVGDLVAGVGIYPGQEAELKIKDIKEQYATFVEYLKKVPSHIHIIMCPGNHDAGRLAEPQLPLYKDFAESLYQLPNVTLVSNPSMLRIGETKSFPGFDVLLYHGYSMPYIADNVESIRTTGGLKRGDLIMEFYMKRRHLAPSHTSNLYIPDAEQDPMVITSVPDFLATGHIHRSVVHQYRGVTLMNCSAWTAATDYQLKRGLIPEPGRAMLVNLKSRKVKVMNFGGQQ
ncbi:metallophosphoesterase [Nanoarchaeota archaeon]